MTITRAVLERTSEEFEIAAKFTGGRNKWKLNQNTWEQSE